MARACVSLFLPSCMEMAGAEGYKPRYRDEGKGGGGIYALIDDDALRLLLLLLLALLMFCMRASFFFLVFFCLPFYWLWCRILVPASCVCKKKKKKETSRDAKE